MTELLEQTKKTFSWYFQIILQAKFTCHSCDFCIRLPFYSYFSHFFLHTQIPSYTATRAIFGAGHRRCQKRYFYWKQNTLSHLRAFLEQTVLDVKFRLKLFPVFFSDPHRNTSSPAKSLWKKYFILMSRNLQLQRSKTDVRRVHQQICRKSISDRGIFEFVKKLLLCVPAYLMCVNTVK